MKKLQILFARLSRVKQLVRTLKIMWKVSKWALISLFALSAFQGLIMPANLIISKHFIDALTKSILIRDDKFTPIYFLLLLLVTATVGVLVNQLSQYIKDTYSDELTIKLTDMILSKTKELTMSQFDDEGTYNKIQLCTQGIPTRCVNLIDGIKIIVQSLVQLISTISIMANENILIMLICLLGTIPLFIGNGYMNKTWYEIFKKRAENNRKCEHIQEIMINNSNIKEVLLFGISDFLKSKVIEIHKGFLLENRRTRRNFGILNMFFLTFDNCVSFILKAWVIVGGIRMSQSLGSISMSISAIDTIQNNVVSFLNQLTSMEEQMLYIETLYELLDLSKKETTLMNLDDKIRTIEFVDVSFKFAHSNHYVLKKVCLKICRGKTYALIGMNGSGKTTLMKLILKLYEPTKGKILVNGVDICRISQESLYRQYSSCFQDFIKYPFDALTNIAISNCEQISNFPKIKEAACYTGAHSFIDDLLNGYNTTLQVGWSEGTGLSGGQWQKVAISRCMFREANVLLLDEPFSALDALSEKYILDNLRKSIQNQLCIFVTHRYSNIDPLDTIIMMDKGRVEAIGTHKELYASCSKYLELFNAQTESLSHLIKQH